MAKFALLIGVGQYGTGLKPLSAPPKDVEAIKNVLENPDIGGFDNVQTLIDPSHSEMRTNIELWLRERKSDDLVVLFFSGHGIKDTKRELYFAARNTQLLNQDQLLTTTAVRAKEVHEHIQACKAKQLVLILDCCYSGAFGDTVGKGDDGLIDLSEMETTGRVVLTSSSTIEISLEEKGQELSTYTHYLVQAISNGIADQKEYEGNEDGWISVDELHQYVCREMKKARSRMTPKIISLKDEGHRIKLTKAPAIHPKLRYRKEFTRIAHEDEGEISRGNRFLLNTLKNQLKLLPEDVKPIEDEVLHPYKVRQTKLQEYEQALSGLAQAQYPLNERDWKALKGIQEILGLRNEDIETIKKKIESQFSSKLQAYEQNLRQYEQEFLKAVEIEHPISEDACKSLKNMQQSLGLKDEDVAPIEARIVAQKQVVQSSGEIAKSIEVQDISGNEELISVESEKTDSAASEEVTSVESEKTDSAAVEDAIDVESENTTPAVGENVDTPLLPIPSNNKLLIKAGIASTTVAVIFLGGFLLTRSPNDQNKSVTPITTSIVSQDLETSKKLLNQGKEELQKGDYQEAIKYFTEYIKSNPNNEEAYIQRGDAYYKQQKYQQAISNYDLAIKINSQTASTYYKRGMTRHDLGDMKGAINDFTEAIKIDSNYADAYYERAESRAHLNDKQGAINDYSEAAFRYRQQGKTEDDQEALKQIKELKQPPQPSLPPPGQCLVIAPTMGVAVRVRIQPIGSSNQIGIVHTGKKVRLIGKQDAFVKIEFNGTQGWVYNDQIKPCS
ncbi:caspase, EACC1-associated type [Floridanema aerugineum]|uniref:Caspase family protein n=1 Tax=Floridaenema aerugineum BLCC-F46 TaxID=3153654 RepID=A0ABV4X652_9CYAN